MKVICFGDSNTWGYDPRSYFGDRYTEECIWTDILAKKTGWEIVNLGINGQEIPKSTPSQFKEADMVLIMLGTNDLLQGMNAEQAGVRMQLFLEKIHQKAVLITPPPLKLGAWIDNSDLLTESRLLADYFRKAASATSVDFVDTNDWNIPLAYDGVHFTELGHMIFADRLHTFLHNN